LDRLGQKESHWIWVEIGGKEETFLTPDLPEIGPIHGPVDFLDIQISSAGLPKASISTVRPYLIVIETKSASLLSSISSLS
jgi:hypothetical protein